MALAEAKGGAISKRLRGRGRRVLLHARSAIRRTRLPMQKTASGLLRSGARTGIRKDVDRKAAWATGVRWLPCLIPKGTRQSDRSGLRCMGKGAARCEGRADA